MRGILWRWLFLFGSVLWISLCLTDYYYKYQEKDKLNTIEWQDKDEVSVNTKQPPALTFWKTLSMILSFSALVYIKRSSNNNKRNVNTNIILPYPRSQRNSNIELYRDLTVLPTRINYYKDVKNNQIVPEELRELCQSDSSTSRTSPISGAVGVEMVQKKLEILEKSVASLKQRRCQTSTDCSTSGLVSSSAAFQKFMESSGNLTPPKVNLRARGSSSTLLHAVESPIHGSHIVSSSDSLAKVPSLKTSSTECVTGRKLKDLIINNDTMTSSSIKISSNASETRKSKTLFNTQESLPVETSSENIMSKGSELSIISESSESTTSEEAIHVPGSNLVSTSDPASDYSLKFPSVNPCAESEDILDDLD